MYDMSTKSLERLMTCHPLLRGVIKEASVHFPIVVTCGHRNKAEQDKAVAEGRSQVSWPNGNHNKIPSTAVDVAPVDKDGKIDWNDRERFTYMAGFIIGVAAARGVQLRWGGDWNGDTRVCDNKFDDLPHFELLITNEN